MSKGHIYRLLLASVKGLGPRRTEQLITSFGSAREAIDAGPELCAERINRPELKASLSRSWPGKDEYEVLDGRLKACGVTVIERGLSDYPRQLAGVDGPRFLFVKGDVTVLNAPLAAVVGTRSVRPDGVRLTYQVTGWCFERGWTLVSGGAFGVDMTAHVASLRRHMPTVVVLPAGLEHLVPREHLKLFSQIVEEGGCLVSEYLPWTRPFRGGFLKRNRIISGLSQCVVVVRAPLYSGALSTARWGMRQGRAVYTVPGEPNDATARGCLQLLSEGAYPLYSASCLPLTRRCAPGGALKEEAGVDWCLPSEQAPQMKKILSLLKRHPLDVVSLADNLQLSVSSVTAQLMMLMLAGEVMFSSEEGLYRVC